MASEQRWEYLTQRTSGGPPAQNQQIARMAEAGWELVGGGQSDDGPVIYFRRPLAS
jgi:hypothetical protein